MITIVHGNDTFSSRNYIFEQKNKNTPSFDAQNSDLTELQSFTHGSSMFGSNNKIFIENLFSNKAKKNYDYIISILDSADKELEIYIWSNKELPKKALSSFPKHNSQLFKINQNIFNFLDGIKPNNTNNLLMFHETLKTVDVQIVFFMLIRQFRLLLAISSTDIKNIDEMKRLAPWQKSKLEKQANLFGEKKLKEIYKNLYKIDKKTKTGATNLTLVQNIDMLLLEI